MSRLSALALGVTFVAGCELSLTDLPRGEPVLVVHGVLNRAAPGQFILLERSLSGHIYVTGTGPDPSIPVVTEGGIAVPFATVRMVTPAGDTVTAPEVGVPNRNTGIYRFAVAGSALVPEGVYHLLIETQEGEIATARVRVPGGTVAAPGPLTGFDRTRDTVLVEWSAVPGARAYAVRIEGPFGPFRALTEGTQLRLTGSLRNPDLEGLPRVFLPGFRPAVSVMAVDSNYYDYYRSSNDANTGTGLVSRIEGGLGVFGAVVPVFWQRFDVTGTSGDPIEATWEPTEPSPYFASSIRLYLESAQARSGDGDAITGRYAGSFGASGGILGVRRGDSLWLRMLNGEAASDTAEVLRALIRGDSLHATYSKGARYVFVRRP